MKSSPGPTNFAAIPIRNQRGSFLKSDRQCGSHHRKNGTRTVLLRTCVDRRGASQPLWHHLVPGRVAAAPVLRAFKVSHHSEHTPKKLKKKERKEKKRKEKKRKEKKRKEKKRKEKRRQILKRTLKTNTKNEEQLIGKGCRVFIAQNCSGRHENVSPGLIFVPVHGLPVKFFSVDNPLKMTLSQDGPQENARGPGLVWKSSGGARPGVVRFGDLLHGRRKQKVHHVRNDVSSSRPRESEFGCGQLPRVSGECQGLSAGSKNFHVEGGVTAFGRQTVPHGESVICRVTLHQRSTFEQANVKKKDL